MRNYMDDVVQNLKQGLSLVDLHEAISHEYTALVHDVLNGRQSARLLWQILVEESLKQSPPHQVDQFLQDDTNRKRLREFVEQSVGPQIMHFIHSMLNLNDSENQVAVINPRTWSIDQANFMPTFFHNDDTGEFISFMNPDKLLIRVYYSLDHTLGQGAEAQVHVALMGCARKISDDPSIPLKARYRPLYDVFGNLIVARHIMVAKIPKTEATTEKASTIDIRRHQRGSLNLRDLTLPHFYTEESKKVLPGLWSLPRFADFGEDRSLYYQYVDGILMHAIMKEAEFDLLTRLISMKHIAQALDNMHSRGYIHNDIKPQNIIISNDGVATIIDFGLTEKYIETYRDLFGTLQQKIVGTPFYMSPEQINKKSRGTFTVGEICYAKPIRSSDELAWLRRESPQSIVVIDGLDFRKAEKSEQESATPYFFDSYLNQNFFSDTSGHVVPVTGKSDVFSLGVNLLVLVTRKPHLKNPEDIQQILADLVNYSLCLDNLQATLPQPLNISGTNDETKYKDEFENLVKAMLSQNPYDRPTMAEVASRLRTIIQLYFGGDRRFFTTFDEERTYVKNKLFRKN